MGAGMVAGCRRGAARRQACRRWAVTDRARGARGCGAAAPARACVATEPQSGFGWVWPTALQRAAPARRGAARHGAARGSVPPRHVRSGGR